jgi:glycosyltransferase involved in cell wall biosynthesis
MLHQKEREVTNSPIASVVIPAYNEASVIGRCLSTLLSGSLPNELEIVVVCNGCKDNTFESAQKFEGSGVTVLQTPVPSKTNALNLGDTAVQTFPRFYIDADIQVTIEAIRAVVELFQNHPEVMLSAPKAKVDATQSAGLVRAFYRVWTHLPYFTEALIGSGIYAFSREGRALFDRFPDIIADDEYARRLVPPHQRRAPHNGDFTISAPRTLGALININTRARAGTYQLEERFPELTQHRGTSPARTLQTIAGSPQLWLDSPIYLAVMFIAKWRAHGKLSRNEDRVWNRDETARQETH